MRVEELMGREKSFCLILYGSFISNCKQMLKRALLSLSPQHCQLSFAQQKRLRSTGMERCVAECLGDVCQTEKVFSLLF